MKFGLKNQYQTDWSHQHATNNNNTNFKSVTKSPKKENNLNV